MNFDNLQVALNSGNIDEASNIIYDLYVEISDRNKFRLILLSECLPEPLQLDFEKRAVVLDTFFEACKKVALKLTEDSNNKNEFNNQYMSLLKSIADIHVLNESNIEELKNKELFELPAPTIIHMTCVFLENQQRISEVEAIKEQSKSEYINLLSTSISDLNGPNGRLSVDSNLEIGIEMAKLIMGFLFYTARKELEVDIPLVDDVSPYQIASIEKLHKLGVHRGTLEYLWECVKYRGWNFNVFADVGEDDSTIMFYQPPIEEYLKLERAAVERYKYKSLIDVYKKNDLAKSFTNGLPQLLDISNEIDLYNPSTLFSLDDERYRELVGLLRNLNDVSIKSLEFLDDTVWAKDLIGKDKDISFDLVFLFISYLQALSLIYSERSHEQFNDEDNNAYRTLAPRLNINEICAHFTGLFSVEEKKAKELLSLFVYQPRKSKNDFSDLFLQPLIYFGLSEIIMVPSLVKQLNIPRLVEEQFGYWGIDDAYKGYKLESYIRESLSVSPYLKVHIGDLVIDEAFDGRSAEFDFFALFGDRILLIEMKCLRRPYSQKEIFQREKDVFYGVEQVNRRAEVIQRNWDQILEKTTIKNLPKRPPNLENIIKLVCLNIFDFTGKQKDGVIITDASSLTKYFINPVVKANELDLKTGTVNTVKAYSLWSRNYPYADELMKFLKKPLAMRDFYDGLDATPRRIMKIKKEDPNLGMLDYSLVNDPFTLMQKHFRTSHSSKKKSSSFDKRKVKAKQQSQSRKKNR